MNSQLLITLEILLVIVAPLLLLYLRASCSLRVSVLCLLTLPILWYFCYSPLHEMSHVAGTYLAGSTVTYYKLIPSLWLGEFGRAWVTSEGLKHNWQLLTSTSFPYILDILSLIVGILILKQSLSKRPFVIGFLFMLLCLRPAFDFVCEPIDFLLGGRGDIYCVELIIGPFFPWLFILFGIGLSTFSILIVLKRFVGF